MDTSFIQNKYEINKLGRNKYYKNKKCNKLSLVTDIKGIPLSVLTGKGNVHDTSFFDKHFKEIIIISNKMIHKNNNCMMADKGYDSSKIRNKLKSKGWNIIIPYDKRNIRDKQKVKSLMASEKKEYKKRIRIEQTFMRLKQFRRICTRYDKYIKTYLGFIYLGISKIIYEKIMRK